MNDILVLIHSPIDKQSSHLYSQYIISNGQNNIDILDDSFGSMLLDKINSRNNFNAFILLTLFILLLSYIIFIIDIIIFYL